MKVIEQKHMESKNLTVRTQGGCIMSIHDDFGDVIDVDKQGAKQLVELLQEWIDEK